MWQPGYTLEAIEKDSILKALQFYRGNKTQTANALGISIRTLYNKLISYKMAKEGDFEKEVEANKQSAAALADQGAAFLEHASKVGTSVSESQAAPAPMAAKGFKKR